jgi:NDP-sugar pyrophosphorylase family protein
VSRGSDPITAVINAGGQSQRMAASGIALHKALIPVLGVPLVERNLSVLLDQGFRDIIIVVSAKTPDVEAFVRRRGAALADASGAMLECIREVEPLGNMGIAGRIAERAADVLMTFVDNLTALDLQLLVDQHRRGDSALSIATHFEPVQAAHGELLIAGGSVVDYLEKPTELTPVASGVYALKARTAALLPTDRATGAVDLFRLVKERGEKILAFEHAAPWIDVNDRAAVQRADRVVAANPTVFELRSQPPDDTETCVLVRCGSRILVSERSEIEAGRGGRFDVVRSIRDVNTALGISAAGESAAAVGTYLASFDDFDEVRGRTVRYEFFIFDAEGAERAIAPRGFAWLAADDAYWRPDVTQPLRRCIAIANLSS